MRSLFDCVYCTANSIFAQLAQPCNAEQLVANYLTNAALNTFSYAILQNMHVTRRIIKYFLFMQVIIFFLKLAPLK